MDAKEFPGNLPLISAGEAAFAMGVNETTVRRQLERLRAEGLAAHFVKGRAGDSQQRWILTNKGCRSISQVPILFLGS